MNSDDFIVLKNEPPDFTDEVLFHLNGSLSGGDVKDVPIIQTSVGPIEEYIFINFYDTGELKYCYFHPAHPWKFTKSVDETMMLKSLRFSQDGKLTEYEKD